MREERTALPLFKGRAEHLSMLINASSIKLDLWAGLLAVKIVLVGMRQPLLSFGSSHRDHT